ncbi:hypothetical protein NIES4071_94370 [Calothrix sp. NIES-4071]|nr:hypothetical protein NIES4071_94370 [Calothrix sp. NIES-4071]BAZ63702.1 hypothetical protein NIES4105_94300 [Calothrix sp. NIES-4105]
MFPHLLAGRFGQAKYPRSARRAASIIKSEYDLLCAFAALSISARTSEADMQTDSVSSNIRLAIGLHTIFL